MGYFIFAQNANGNCGIMLLKKQFVYSISHKNIVWIIALLYKGCKGLHSDTMFCIIKCKQ